jgi:catechol 2,3-dioxygenase-like lactoylglutathione lyase family enzyme
MKLGYTTLYVEDVAKTLTFYEQAFEKTDCRPAV